MAFVGILALRSYEKCVDSDSFRCSRNASCLHAAFRISPSANLTQPSTHQPTTFSPLVGESTPTVDTFSNKDTFETLYGDRIPSWLLRRLSDLGFDSPTPIQCATLPFALSSTVSSESAGEDVVIHAQTGSGKTLAYLLPAIANVVPERNCVQALVIVPTQELGMQVYKLLRRITTSYAHNTSNSDANCEDDLCEENEEIEEKSTDDSDLWGTNVDEDFGLTDEEDNNDMSTSVSKLSFPVLPMLNQANLRRQKLQLRQVAPRIIVGNPHRVSNLVQSGRLRLDLLKTLVVDEFDACLNDVETTAALQTILAVRNRERPRQTILASATVPQHRHFLRQCVRQHWTRPSIRHVWLEEGSSERVPPSLTHCYAICDTRKKIAALCALLVMLNRDIICEEDSVIEKNNLSIHAIVFVMPSRDVEIIANVVNDRLKSEFEFPDDARPVEGLHNDLAVGRRRKAVTRFRDGDARILVATDVAARGLDFPDVTHVFHFDLPRDADGYLHRAGRAGRQGRPGTSVVLVTKGEEFVIRRTGNTLGIEFDRVTR